MNKIIVASSYLLSMVGDCEVLKNDEESWSIMIHVYLLVSGRFQSLVIALVCLLSLAGLARQNLIYAYSMNEILRNLRIIRTS